MFIVWIVKTTEFTPKLWSENPNSAVALFPMTEYTNLESAREYAKGFNLAEIANPVSMWAVVCKKDNEPKEMQKIELKSNG
jgi:hypothetical protein